MSVHPSVHLSVRLSVTPAVSGVCGADEQQKNKSGPTDSVNRQLLYTVYYLIIVHCLLSHYCTLFTISLLYTVYYLIIVHCLLSHLLNSKNLKMKRLNYFLKLLFRPLIYLVFFYIFLSVSSGMFRFLDLDGEMK